MKTILAFGDSLTWGSDPASAGRHRRADRWPTVLAEGLGAGFEVITDGMRGRTTAYDEHLADCDRNGARLLPSSLYAHAPLDLVILMLGTNDLKPALAGSAAAALQGMRRLTEIAMNHSARLPGQPRPRVLIVAPPHLVETTDPFFGTLFAGGIAQSRLLAGLYAGLAAETSAAFFDAAGVARASPVDGVHCDAASTRAIGKALVPIVTSMLAA